MAILSLFNIIELMGISLFMIGVITLLIGIGILVRSTNQKDIRALTAQTTRLAQKGITDDIAGLVGNASNLLKALHDMVRTATGIGVFLSILGSQLSLGGVWLILSQS
jgi:hypothetical protein